VVVARSAEPLQKLKEKYTKQVEVVNGDLADFSLAQKAVDAAVSTFGGLDGMVLNHGILGQVGKIEIGNTDEWRQAFDVNFFSLLAFVRPNRISGYTPVFALADQVLRTGQGSPSTTPQIKG